ncbi:tape measure protein [Mesorhizobium sp. CO1-1-9]|uniref:tape measure protein n=1 Tax=Mesorhizobium sp. CO1-1-9 TaxID=2876630 RepID=UPI001CC94609|nr:tape measure protein [Mesorhizobium sp. CO1-1-9]MBZ9694537.1 tape measure protein [Mesorhizobium sp. CO1-1-9]
MDDGQQLLLTFDAKFERYMRNFERAQQQTDQRFRAIEQRAKVSATRLESSFATASSRINTGLKGIGAGFLAGVSLQGAQKLIDTATKIQNALKVAGLSGEDLTKVYDTLFASAQKNAVPLEALVQLYGRAAQQQRELGVSSAQLLTFTDHVALALRVAGTDAGQASGALLQLGQALGSGTVHAEEFNSVLEGAPTIAQAAAAGIKEAGGSVAALKQLVVDGKLSSKAFFDGFAAGATTLQERVAGSETTISGHMVRLQNVLVDVAGKFDESAHATELFGRFLDDVGKGAADSADQINSAGPALGEFERLINNINEAAQNLGKNIGAVTGLDQVAPAINHALSGVETDPVKAKLTDLQKTVSSLQDAIKFNTEMGIDTSVVQAQLDQVLAKIAAIKSGAVAVVAPLADQSDKGVTDAINGMVPFNPLADQNASASNPKQISLADYPVTGGSGKSKGAGTRAKGPNDFQREIAQTQARIAALRAETAAQAGVNPLVDDYGRAVETARIRQELLTAAQKAGVAITPEVAAKIDQLAESYADASVASRQLADEQDKTRQSAEDFASIGKDVVGGFISDLRSGKSAAEALANALNKVADKLLDMALNSLFSTTTSGGIFGAIGSLFGFSAGGEVKRFAGGGHVRGPGTSTSDSIPARLSAGEYVVNARATARNRALLEAINNGDVPGLASGGSLDGSNVGRLHRPANDNPAQVINLPVSVTVNAQGGDHAQNRDLARQTARQTQDAVRAVVISELQNQMRPGGIMSGRGRN